MEVKLAIAHLFLHMAQGIPPSRILYVNLESMMHADIRTAKGLYGYVKEHISAEGRPVILLDEIQEVTGWEQAVNGLLADLKADLYITGSNARLLSSELATYLAGRYVEFHIMPYEKPASVPRGGNGLQLLELFGERFCPSSGPEVRFEG